MIVPAIRARGALRWLLPALLTLTLAGGAHATTYLKLTPMQMLDKAAIVFVGTVSDVSVSTRAGQPWTDVTFAVGTALEGIPTDADGNAKGPETLSFLGGDAPGGPSLTVGGMPRLQVGDRVLVFAYDQNYASPIVGFRQGLWHVTGTGLVDEDGNPLSVGSGGDLTAGAPAATLQQVIDAIRTHLAGKQATP